MWITRVLLGRIWARLFWGTRLLNRNCSCLLSTRHLDKAQHQVTWYIVIFIIPLYQIRTIALVCLIYFARPKFDLPRTSVLILRLASLSCIHLSISGWSCSCDHADDRDDYGMVLERIMTDFKRGKKGEAVEYRVCIRKSMVWSFSVTLYTAFHHIVAKPACIEAPYLYQYHVILNLTGAIQFDCILTLLTDSKCNIYSVKLTRLILVEPSKAMPNALGPEDCSQKLPWFVLGFHFKSCFYVKSSSSVL